MNQLFWVMMPMAVSIYMLGVVMGRRGWQPMSRQESKIKHWYECDECLPGVTQQFGADTKDHLEQVIQWHKEDFHEGEDECSDTNHGPTSYLHQLQWWWFTKWDSVVDAKRRGLKRLRFSLMNGSAHIAFQVSSSRLGTLIRQLWTEPYTSTCGPFTPT